MMSAEDMVDAALAGYDAGEFATVPALADAGLWEQFDESRTLRSLRRGAAFDDSR
jgi:uncharacterized protein